MRTPLPVLAAGLAASLVSGAAGAASISYVSQDRFVSVMSFFDGSSDSDAATGFSPFASAADILHARASQDSTLGSTTIDGDLSAFIFDAADAASHFDLTFTIDETTPFTLAGSVTGDREASFRLSEVGGSDVVNVYLGSPSEVFDVDGVLAAGTYEIAARAGAFPGALPESLDNRVRLDFALVPEPGTAMLLLAGLAACCGLRRN